MSDKFKITDVNWKWVLISSLIFFVAQILVTIIFGLLGVITLGIGFILFIVIKPTTYFVGGYIAGYFSTGRTILEPAIGALLVAVIGGFFDNLRSESLGMFGLVLSCAFAFVFALVGSFLGEKAQIS